MNGKFLEKYGKQWERMTEAERDMAVMSELFDLREELVPLKSTCEIVKRHVVYFKAVAIISGLVTTGIIGWLISRVLG